MIMAKAIQLLKKGADLVRKKQWSKAADVFLQATEKAPKDPRCWFGLGISLFKVRNFDVARMALERAKNMGHPKAEKVLAWVERAESRQDEEQAGADKAAAGAGATTAADATQPDDLPMSAEEAQPEPEEEQMDLGHKVLVMLIEPEEQDCQNIKKAIEDRIKDARVETASFDISSADTLSGKVYHDVAVLDWDADPSAAAGAVQIFKLKRPHMQILCLTEDWDPKACSRILKAGADYHLVKERDFASTIPLVIGQLAHRDEAVLKERGGEDGGSEWAACMDAIDERMLLIGMDFTIRQANEAATKTWAPRSGRMKGQRYPGVLYGRHEPPESCPIYKALDLQQPTAGEMQDPNTGDMLGAKAWPVFDDDSGDVTGAVALVTDEAVGGAGDDGEGKSRLANLLDESMDHLQCGVVALDEDGCISWVNSVAAELMCSDRESLAGVDYTATFSNALEDLMQDPSGFVAEVRDAHERGEAMEDCEMQLGNSVTGEVLSYWSTPVESDDPAVARIEHYYPTIEAEPVTPPSEEETESMVEQMAAALADVVFTADQDGKITWTNRGNHGSELRPRKLRGKALQDLALPEERQKVQDLLRKSLSNGSHAQKQEIAISPKKGSKRWAELILLPSSEESENGQAVRGILRDVTERKLNQAIREILSGNKAVETALEE